MRMEYEKLKYIATFPTGKLNSNAAEIDGKYPFFTCAHEIYRINTYSYDGEYVLLGGNNASGDFPIFYYNGKFDAYQRTYLIQPVDSNSYLTRYLYYAIGLRLSQMKGNAAGTATKFLTQSILNNLFIEIRRTDKQKKIITVLSAYDNLIEVNNKRIKALEQMAENLYKEWFVRFRFPGHETAEFENGIPKGWKTQSLGKWLVDNFNGGWGEENYTDKTPFMAYVIRGTDIEDINNSHFHDVPCRYHKKTDFENKQLCQNDIILELSNGNINNIGRTLFVREKLLSHFNTVICASFCKTLRFANKEIAFFVWKYIEYLQYSGLLSFYKNTGANGINNFNFKRFLRMPICIPMDFSLLRIIMKYSDEAAVIRELNYNLIKQRDLLLPRLMSGKLEV